MVSEPKERPPRLATPARPRGCYASNGFDFFGPFPLLHMDIAFRAPFLSSPLVVVAAVDLFPPPSILLLSLRGLTTIFNTGGSLGAFCSVLYPFSLARRFLSFFINAPLHLYSSCNFTSSSSIPLTIRGRELTRRTGYPSSPPSSTHSDHVSMAFPRISCCTITTHPSRATRFVLCFFFTFTQFFFNPLF